MSQESAEGGANIVCRRRNPEIKFPADFMGSDEIKLDMPTRLRALLRRMSTEGTEIPNPVAEFAEKWKNVSFSTPLYSRAIYTIYNYLNNPEVNLDYSRFVANADVIIDMLNDVLISTRKWLDSQTSPILAASSKFVRADDDEFRILLFITEFLVL